MKHRTLGLTGLIVSELALGRMQFGGKMNMGSLGQEDTQDRVLSRHRPYRPRK
jgi:aryl-alcohol dehydrogenase-like predicted oxidoreductase